jgi:teichuronic acid biosynthesis glycosyltransferase TuaC
VHERVSLVGSKPNDELKYWFSAADVSCLASSREGWANVLLESLACGTPVVATRVWGAPEVINSPQLGILVDQTVESIGEGLKVALGKEWDHGILIRYASSRTWDVVAEEVENFLAARLAGEGRVATEASHA